MGANHLGQLGVGSQMSQSLHPMLVRAFEGKVITKLVAGQYHNAAVADGLLYTWGWGVYGQLGHGTIADEPIPKIVEFFRGKVRHSLLVSSKYFVLLLLSLVLLFRKLNKYH